MDSAPEGGGLDAARARLALGYDHPAPSPHGWIGQVARRAVYRLLRPYAYRQREVDTALVEAIAAERQRVDHLLSAISALHDRVAALDAHLLGHAERIEQDLARIRQQALYPVIGSLIERLDGGAQSLLAHERSVFSQSGEDGVLIEILRRLGRRRGHFVEIGAHSNEANCLFVADALRWSGLFVDANAEQCQRLVRRYQVRTDVAVRCAMVGIDNIEQILRDAATPPDFDVLSIDVDGNDYWLWQAITDHTPAVVIIEHNCLLDPDRPLVQEYDPDRGWDETDFFGASLGAMRELGTRKGYALVHTELGGTNLFFVRRDLVGDRFDLDAATVRPANYCLYMQPHREHTGGRRYLDLSELPDRTLIP